MSEPRRPAESVPQEPFWAALPPEWPDDLLDSIQAARSEADQKVVVIDDDPTGTQTVHGIPVLTHWDTAALRAELEHDLAAFYLLSNSRSLSGREAEAVNVEIGANLREAARACGRKFVVVSRSDSTLRGHFPAEVAALDKALGGRFAAWLLIPFFEEGGRYTVDDIHWVAEGDWLVPAGETAFARDAVFGYRSSNLRAWVEEKTLGSIAAADVKSISLDDIRTGGPDRVAERLRDLTGGELCVVNAASMRDVQVVALAILTAEAQGKRFLYRTSASFVPVRAGMPARSWLTRAELALKQSGGALFVVGSHVPKTTVQLQTLLNSGRVIGIECRTNAILDDNLKEGEIRRAVDRVNNCLSREKDVAVYTSRILSTGASEEDNLAIGKRISHALVELVRRLSQRPRYLVAKGGITSSDIATLGLGVKRAMVEGQILPGVPVWQLGEESRYPGLCYIVFPGNVGDAGALVDVWARLKPAQALGA